MDIYLGKKTDLLTLKKDIVKNIEEKIRYYRESRTRLYAGPTEYVSHCPVSDLPTSQSLSVANVYGADYVQSPIVGHVYVRNRPTGSAIREFYLNDVTYAATYTSREAAESRLNAIAVPWRDWLVSVYEKQYGHKPRRVLDVGSGAGHFVEACRRAGMQAEGIELSEASRRFAGDVWGIKLDGRDFCEVVDEYRGVDVVTFWGLLEHTPCPARILGAAREVLGIGGMVVSKVPRWDSLSTAVQRLNPEGVIRHIDPMGHIMLFTDASAAELYVRSGFRPVTAWYYGMDVYEMLMQVGNIVGEFSALLGSGQFQVELQQFVDEARFADGLTLVGVPGSQS